MLLISNIMYYVTNSHKPFVLLFFCFVILSLQLKNVDPRYLTDINVSLPQETEKEMSKCCPFERKHNIGHKYYVRNIKSVTSVLI